MDNIDYLTVASSLHRFDTLPLKERLALYELADIPAWALILGRDLPLEMHRWYEAAHGPIGDDRLLVKGAEDMERFTQFQRRVKRMALLQFRSLVAAAPTMNLEQRLVFYQRLGIPLEAVTPLRRVPNEHRPLARRLTYIRCDVSDEAGCFLNQAEAAERFTRFVFWLTDTPLGEVDFRVG